jgi:asparagine N-glycosylation enzyme membrane subunit Stt3
VKQNDREMTYAHLYATGQIALAVLIVAGIIWLWGWEAGITAIAVMAAAFIMLCFSLLVATIGNAHLLAAAVLAVCTAILYIVALPFPFIYGEWFAISWFISVLPLARVSVGRWLERRKMRRRTPKY